MDRFVACLDDILVLLQGGKVQFNRLSVHFALVRDMFSSGSFVHNTWSCSDWWQALGLGYDKRDTHL